jgi:multidrug efflux pump subunit AcrB
VRRLVLATGLLGSLALGCGGLGAGLLSTPAPQGITITTEYPGASPAEVEHTISIPVELAVVVIEGVQGVESLSTESASVVTAWYDPGEVEPYALRSALLEALQRSAPTLPQDADTPRLGAAAPQDRLLTRVAVGGAEGWQACARDLADRALTVPGVDRVLTAGLDTQRVVIQVDPDRLGAMGLAIEDVHWALTSTMLLPSDTSLRVTTLRNARSIEELGRVVLTVPTGVPLVLSDLASIQVDTRPSAPIVFLDQRPAALLSFLHQPQADRASTLRSLGQALEAVEARCSAGAQLQHMTPSAQVLALELDLPPGDEARTALAKHVEAIELDTAPAAVVLELGRPLYPGPGSALTERARLLLRYDRPPPDGTMAELIGALQASPGLRVLSWEGPGSHLELLLRGEDHAALTQSARQLAQALALPSQQTVVHDGLPPERPEIDLEVDEVRLAAYGISLAELHRAVRIATACLPVGEPGQPGADALPVELCSSPEGESPMQSVLGTRLRTPDGQAVPLSAVANVELHAAPAASLRVDLFPALRLGITSTEPDGRKLEAAVLEQLDELQLPAGVSVELRP